MEIASVAWDPTYFVAYRDLVAFYEVDVTWRNINRVYCCESHQECATMIQFAPHNALPLLPAPRLDATPLCRVVSADTKISLPLHMRSWTSCVNYFTADIVYIDYITLYIYIHDKPNRSDISYTPPETSSRGSPTLLAPQAEKVFVRLNPAETTTRFTHKTKDDLRVQFSLYPTHPKIIYNLDSFSTYFVSATKFMNFCF